MHPKILLVDDSSIMRRILKVAAQATIKNVEIFEAENGQEALECLEKKEDIKLILLDINMPVMDGKKFIKILREEEKYDNVRVIIQTTETDDEHINYMKQFKISGYLMKPYQKKIVQQLMTKLAPVIGYETVEKQ